MASFGISQQHTVSYTALQNSKYGFTRVLQLVEYDG